MPTKMTNRAEMTAALDEVAAIVSREQTLQQLLDHALAKTLEIMEIEAGEIYLLQADSEVLTIAAHSGLSPELVAAIDNLKLGEGFAGRVAQSGEPMIVQDQTTDSRLTRPVAAGSGFHSLALVPLAVQAKILGTLAVISRERREFSNQDMELLAAIGDQVGAAVKKV